MTQLDSHSIYLIPKDFTTLPLVQSFGDVAFRNSVSLAGGKGRGEVVGSDGRLGGMGKAKGSDTYRE